MAEATQMGSFSERYKGAREGERTFVYIWEAHELLVNLLYLRLSHYSIDDFS